MIPLRLIIHVWRGVSLGVSFSRQIPALFGRKSGTDALFSLESRHFDGLGPLSRLPLDQESPGWPQQAAFGSSPGGAMPTVNNRGRLLSGSAWAQDHGLHRFLIRNLTALHP